MPRCVVACSALIHKHVTLFPTLSSHILASLLSFNQFYPWNDSVSTPKFHLLKISCPSPKAVSPPRRQPEERFSSAPCLLHPLPSLSALTTQGVVFISHCGVAVCLSCGKPLRLQQVEYSLYLRSR